MSKKEEEAKKTAPRIQQVNKEGRLLKEVIAIAKNIGIRLKMVKHPEDEIPVFHSLVAHFPSSREWDNTAKSDVTAFLESLKAMGKQVAPIFLDDGDPVLVDDEHMRKLILFG